MTERLRTPAVLGGASLAAGLLAYVLFALLTRPLGPTDAAPIAIMWTYWGLSAAAVTFPVQHWVAHAVAVNGGFAAASRALPRLRIALVVVSLAAGGASWLLRDTLFGRTDVHFPALIALMTVGAFVMGLSRGILTARRHFGTLGASLVGEQLARVVPTLVLVLADVRNQFVFGLVIVAGSFVTLLRPGMLRMPPTGAASSAPSFLSLGSSASAQLLAQMVLTSGPIILAVLGGAPEAVTALFASLAVFRAPFILAQSQVAALTGRWTLLVSSHRARELGRLRLILVLGAGPCALAAAGVGATVGGPVVRLIFGSEVEISPLPAALIAAASTIAVVNLAATVLSIAHGRPSIALAGWVAGTLVGSIVLFLPWTPELRTVSLFLIAEAMACAVMLVALARAQVGKEPSGRA